MHICFISPYGPWNLLSVQQRGISKQTICCQTTTIVYLQYRGIYWTTKVKLPGSVGWASRIQILTWGNGAKEGGDTFLSNPSKSFAPQTTVGLGKYSHWSLGDKSEDTIYVPGYQNSESTMSSKFWIEKGSEWKLDFFLSLINLKTFYYESLRELHPFTGKIPNLVKQFVVTNCSKERSGSIVNKTLKNGILIIKDTSKESDFHANFKFISFIKFSVSHRKLRAWENLPYFGK